MVNISFFNSFLTSTNLSFINDHIFFELISDFFKFLNCFSLNTLNISVYSILLFQVSCFKIINISKISLILVLLPKGNISQYIVMNLLCKYIFHIFTDDTLRSSNISFVISFCIGTSISVISGSQSLLISIVIHFQFSFF
ncbi:hypothetical protein HOB94_02340 [bacterium]|nr:hypothetical protein [bacterium]